MPSWLVEALDRRLEGRGRGDLHERSARISTAYRAGRASSGVVKGEGDALAYATARMPATFAAATAVFTEVEALLPGFHPSRICDAGAGPGTAGFAALHLWPDADALVQVDHNPAFLAIGRDFASPLAVELSQRQAELSALPFDLGRFDLTILGYVLAEFDRAGAGELAARLFAATDGLLVIIEPGTPEGYARILAARGRLVADGAHILAPCPHEKNCPLVAPDWCHFSERLPRRRAHMAVKGAALPFEDERFSYLVAARQGFAETARLPRIIAPPEAGKAAIAFKLCRPEGTSVMTSVARRDKAAFAAARRLRWGDRFATPSAVDGKGESETL